MELNGLESLNKANIDGDKVSKHLESGTEVDYNRMLVLSFLIPSPMSIYLLSHNIV